MGRNRKTGLDYFPFDVDTFQDIKIRKLIKYQSGKAVTVYALLLCLIYKGGYYMRWDEELPFIISEQTGFEEAYIQEVIKSCMVLGLFSKELFDKERVLTSKGIQERYRDICKQINRKFDFVEFSIISSEEKPISLEEIGISSEEKLINSEKSTQKKIKGKEKEKKEDINISSFSKEECDSACESPSPSLSETPHEKIPLEEITDMWNSICPNFPKVEKITDKRKAKIPIRVKEMGGWNKAKPILENIFKKVQQSKFLNGDNNRGWKCFFDWIFENESNWVKVYEGNYDNGNPYTVTQRASIDRESLSETQKRFYDYLETNGKFLLNMPVFPTDEEIKSLNGIPRKELTRIVKEINNKTYLLNGRTGIFQTIMELKQKEYGN